MFEFSFSLSFFSKDEISSTSKMDLYLSIILSNKLCYLFFANSINMSVTLISSLNLFPGAETTIIFLDVSLEEIRRRIENITERGIVGLRKHGLEELYRERIPLYRKYAHVVIDATPLNEAEILEKCVNMLPLKKT